MRMEKGEHQLAMCSHPPAMYLLQWSGRCVPFHSPVLEYIGIDGGALEIQSSNTYYP